MSKGFSFEPRGLTAKPKKFGKHEEPLRPASGVASTDPRFLAASAQHLLSFKVQEYLRQKGKSVEWFASSEAGHPGLSVDRMRRMLRGETMMQLADVALITRIVPRAMEAWATTIGGEAVLPFEQLRSTRSKLLVCNDTVDKLVNQLDGGAWRPRSTF